MGEVAALTWTSEEEKYDEYLASVDLNASDIANFLAARTQVDNWIASIRTPIKQSTNQVNPSPHPMQQLASTTGHNVDNNVNWRHNLFASIRERVQT